MFTHVIAFCWIPGTTPEQVEAVAAALRALPAQIPELRSYKVGPDAGAADGNWDFAVVAEFDDEDGWRAYAQHPAHQRVVHDLVGPIRGERAAVQFRS